MTRLSLISETPPCEHPGQFLSWDQMRFRVACSNCDQEVTLQGLVEQARVTMSRGCTCGEECSGTCGAGEPLGWTLDPAQVMAYVHAEEEGTRQNHSLMVTFHERDWAALLRLAEVAGSSPERFCQANVIRGIRLALGAEGLTLQDF